MAISSDIAAILQLIQQQQAIEERKEERNQDLALSLFKMGVATERIETENRIKAEASLYQDNMQIVSDTQKTLDVLETKFGETVGDLDLLSEIYVKDGKALTKEIYEGEATNWTERSDLARQNAEMNKEKIRLLQNKLFTDVKQAQNVMLGGVGFQGGTDEERWDMGDLGLLSYESKYGEASPTVIAMFKNNPGVMTDQLAKLQKRDLELGEKEQKAGYYYDTRKSKEAKAKTDKGNLAFGGILNSAAKTSGKQTIDGLLALSAEFDTDTPESDVAKNQNQRLTLQSTIGKEFANLLGREVSDVDYLTIYDEYSEMHSVGKAKAATGLGEIASGNWSVVNSYLQEAKNNYNNAISSGDTRKAELLNQYAIKYFGMPTDPNINLNSFANDMNQFYIDTTLSTFQSSGSIEDPNDNEGSNATQPTIEEIDSAEWNELGIK